MSFLSHLCLYNFTIETNNVICNNQRMIRSFNCKKAESIWEGNSIKGVSLELQNSCRRKLRMINNAREINDLKIPPGNRLESLKGTRKGQFSIRVNQQWRICFIWKEKDAYHVHIVDYH